MNYKNLEVYKRAYKLSIEIYKFSLKLPRELQYDLADQIRRASRSIPSNLAEGLGKHLSGKDKIKFVSISLGSNDEILFNLDFLKDVNLIDSANYLKFTQEYTICGKQLNALITSISSFTKDH